MGKMTLNMEKEARGMKWTRRKVKAGTEMSAFYS